MPRGIALFLLRRGKAKDQYRQKIRGSSLLSLVDGGASVTRT